MKMPEPMMPLMTIIVASNRVRRRAKPELGRSSMNSPSEGSAGSVLHPAEGRAWQALCCNPPRMHPPWGGIGGHMLNRAYADPRERHEPIEPEPPQRPEAARRH